MVPKLCVHVTEGIPSAHEKFYSNRLKIRVARKIMMAVTLTAVPKYELRNVIRFLMLEYVSSNEIHTRMCMIYGPQNVITKSTVN